MRLALAGGGTGGHLVPGLHLLDDLAARGGALEDLLWFTGGRPVEQRVLAGLAERVAPTPVRVVTLGLERAGGGAPSRARQALRMFPAARRASALLHEHGSQVLLGLGGFVCGPAVLGATRARVPRALVEINAHGGTATRLLGPLAERVFHAWGATLPGAGGSRHVLSGAPLGPRYKPADERATQAARQSLGFDPKRPLLVILGGSQGAGAINQFVAEHAPAWVAGGNSILHQTGPGKLDSARTTSEHHRAVEYLSDMPQALSAARIALGRGGASTLAEVAAVRVPVWVVPYPHHGDRHQELNARQLGAGAQIVQEEELGPELAANLSMALSEAGHANRESASLALEKASPGGAARCIWEHLQTIGR
ncbi:MAG: UDP-N-acetylglucosamine--N-acetylmuramyl-(pentapeptide) pyrophosphoryl-undecaprenol N-acetylglucosamine transferase [Planctomycetota bacterium]|jgi:UDP-N-acetylglucosamine--N-acetylmuramyl-(pentapeptide) pyrophosphoryl-undecaprenol N-acetylglucosamine transferase